MPTKSMRRRVRMISVAAAAVSIPAAAWAESDWIGNSNINQSWSLGTNWSTTVVPGANAVVVVKSSGGVIDTVDYDYSGAGVTLSTFLVDYTVSADGFNNTLIMDKSDTMTVATKETAGDLGLGAIDQSAGHNTINNGSLVLGNQVGSFGDYILQGTGTLTANNSFGTAGNAEIVGENGFGTVDQLGGNNVSNGTILIGDAASSEGNYDLSGTGNMAIAGSEFVGNNGAGFFTQSGGRNAIASGNLTIASTFFATGSYTLSAGTLTLGAGNVLVGASGSGTFVQSGGFAQVGAGEVDIGTFIDGRGTYDLSGGTLLASQVYVSGGSLVTVGGTGGSGLLNITAGTVMCNDMYVGYAGPGSVNQSGGLNSMTLFGASMYVGYLEGGTGAYTLSATGVLNDSGGNEIIGDNGIGLFNQSGGTNTVGIGLGIGLNSRGVGTYILSAGSLTVASTETIAGGIVGAGTAHFIQTGGSNSCGGITMAYLSGATATYTLGNTGVLTSGGAEEIAVSGLAVFNQSGGTNLVTASGVELGVSAGGTGTYILSGTGSLSTPGLEVGGGSGSAGGRGVLNVSGGTLFIPTTGTLTVYNTSGSSFNFSGGMVSAGSLNLSGNYSLLNWTAGTLALTNTGHNVVIDSVAGNLASSLTLGPSQELTVASTEIVGNTSSGTMSLAGGTNIINGDLQIGSSAGSTGTFGISGSGQVSAANIYLAGPTTFGATAFFNLSASGAVFATFNEYVGYNGNGTFNQSGGLNSAAFGLTVGDENGASGSYSLSAGSLAVSPGSETIGGSVGGIGTGFFVQSGGLNTTGGVTLGFTSGSTGTYTLSGTGTLMSSGAEIVGLRATGNFNQTGGLNRISGGELDVAQSGASNGTYTLAGTGSLSVFNVFVGGASSGAGGTGILTVSNSAGMSVGGTLKVWNAGRVNLDVPNTATGGVFIVGNGIVNLNGALTINIPGGVVDPINTIVGYLKSGYNGGAWTGTAGIISTSLQNQTGPAVSLGYADGRTDAGTAAGPNQIVVKYTLVGDANLDGLVNFGDLVAVVQHFNKGGTDWAGGNFFYGASTNFGDLVAVVQNFNKTLPPPSGSSAGLGGTTIPLGPEARIQSTDVQLPEPAAICMISIAATGLLRRRRRKYVQRKSLLNS